MPFPRTGFVNVNDPNFSEIVLDELANGDELSGSEVDGCEVNEFQFSDHESDSVQSESDVTEEEEVEEENYQHNSNYFRGRGKERFKWAKSPPTRRVRTPAHNIVLHLPGVKGPARDLGSTATPLQVWELLFPESMINKIVIYTNQKIVEYRDKYKQNDRPELIPVDIIEMKAFLGLLLLSSIFKSGHENLGSLFSTDGFGRDVFRFTMSKLRFEILLACLRFDDRTTREIRKQSDPVAAVSEMFYEFIENSQKNYCIGENVCIDEMLVAFRGRCKFKVYIPSKPARYGLKVLCLTDARNSYLFNAYIYCGKNSDGNTLTSEERKLSIPTQSVVRLAKPLMNTNRNIIVDRWFTSIQLLQTLLKSGLTCVGTIIKNKKEIPLEFHPNKLRSPGSTLFGFTKDFTLASYVPKKSKAVLLVSSVHHDNSVDDLSGKPEIILYYNNGKAGVDSLDEKCSIYSPNRRTRRWPMAIFYRVLAMSTVNGYIIYQSLPNSDKMDRFTFIKAVGECLIKPFMEVRSTNQRLPRELRTDICMFLGIEPESNRSVLSTKNSSTGKRKRCHLCPRTKDRKIRSICSKCKEATCSECGMFLCQKCATQ